MTARFNVWLTNQQKGAFFSRPHAEIKKFKLFIHFLALNVKTENQA